MLPASSTNSIITFYLNGRKVSDDDVDPAIPLSRYLRYKLGFKGTKIGCGEGGCGACTVMISRYNRQTYQIENMSVNSCLVPVCSLHGLAVTTVEGIGSTRNGLHVVQERLAKSHGTQCGYCSPGMVMSMYTLLRNNPMPSMDDIHLYLQGNLCRCTGYRPILEGFRTFTSGCGVANCCQQNGNGRQQQNGEVTSDIAEENIRNYDDSQDPIFPPELQTSDQLDKQSLVIVGENVTFLRPVSLNELLELKFHKNNAVLVKGNTLIGLGAKFSNIHPGTTLISTAAIPELSSVKETDSGLIVGSSVSITNLLKAVESAMHSRKAHEVRSLRAIENMIKVFGSQQIRNVGSVGGAIMCASPVSDLGVILMAIGATAKLESKNGSRDCQMDDNFYKETGGINVNPNEILTEIRIPYTTKNEYIFGYKEARREEFDRAVVDAGLKVCFEDKTNVIRNITLAFGGLRSNLVLASKTMHSLVKRKWDNEMAKVALQSLSEEFTNIDDPSGYKLALVKAFFIKFFLSTLEMLNENQVLHKTTGHKSKGITDNNDRSAISSFSKGIPESSQIFQEVESGQLSSDAVGRPVAHISSLKHTTGEAVYCDDMPTLQNELFMVLVMSEKAHADIVSIDATDALAQTGVVAFFCAKDISEVNNKYGLATKDEEVFATKKVTCYGQVIGALVATTYDIAHSALKKVKIHYRDVKPLILNIRDAIKENSFFNEFTDEQSLGSVEDGFNKCDRIVEGELYVGGQEHMYLETHSVFIVPKEEDEFDIFATVQGATDVQASVSTLLEIPRNKIHCHVKRLGGAFGGKATRAPQLILPAAFASRKLNRPIRATLDRDEDMILTGKRHDYLAKYKVGFTAEGKVLAAELTYYINAGNTVDASPFVLLVSILSTSHGYHIPNMRIKGILCRTNLPSNTAMRGFGRPQVFVLFEHIFDHIASVLVASPEQIKYKNLNKDGDVIVANLVLENCTIRRCWDKCVELSDFNASENEIERFNKNNRWKKRGIAMTPVMMGVGFEAGYACQGGCLVNIYLDGSVYISIGGIEMGQGLFTKVAQVASRVLGAPISKIVIGESVTSYVPNTSLTGGSYNTDLYGNAVKNACTILSERINSLKNAMPNSKWEELVTAAYMNQISLSSTGYWKSDTVNYDPATKTGNPFEYFTNGVACSVVEIDCLTGAHKVLRTDIVMDVGNSINPAIDIGQIEGGFMQGYGMYMLEELKVNSDGSLASVGPSTYKVPTIASVPIKFTVALLHVETPPRTIYSSKGIGEPPFMLGSSVMFAAKKAICAARAANGFMKPLILNATPLTAEKIALACKNFLLNQQQLHFDRMPMLDSSPTSFTERVIGIKISQK